jgi:site-specific DNA-methyltransferase (adenine-specific)
MEPNSVDSIVTDPPYGLSFMGKKWDYDVPSKEIWEECLRVLKPGGHLLAFAGTRTQHRMAVNIEDAGFEIRDMIAWVYGSGFPKSLDVSKAIDKSAGAKRKVVGPSPYAARAGNGRSDEYTFNVTAKDSPDGRNITAPSTPEAKKWEGYGTALKPALEPITVARKPLSEKNVASNVLKWGTGAINIDGCRVGTEKIPLSHHNKTLGGNGKYQGGVAMQTGGATGRFPANFIHDGSQLVMDLFPYTKSGEILPQQGGNGNEGVIAFRNKPNQNYFPADSGSAARFFYCPKANKKDRDEGCEKMPLVIHQSGMGGDMPTDDEGNDRDRFKAQSRNHHPTVKPTDLMRYLCRLVTPQGGIVLDPFMGSGSTGKAAMLEGFGFVGIEREQEYLDIAKARIEFARKNPR